MDWPPLPEPAVGREELQKILYAGQIDEVGHQLRGVTERRSSAQEQEWKAEEFSREVENAERRAEREAEIALNKVIHDALVEVAKGSLERGKSGAEFVRNSAAVVVTLYTGILGLTFSATKRTLPARGLVPAIFLGLALVLVTGYMAWLTMCGDSPSYDPHTSPPIIQSRRLNAFINWVTQLAADRAPALHGAVVSLGFGVLTLPLPFLRVNDGLALTVLPAGILVTIAVTVMSWRALRETRDQGPGDQGGNSGSDDGSSH